MDLQQKHWSENELCISYAEIFVMTNVNADIVLLANFNLP